MHGGLQLVISMDFCGFTATLTGMNESERKASIQDYFQAYLSPFIHINQLSQKECNSVRKTLLKLIKNDDRDTLKFVCNCIHLLFENNEHYKLPVDDFDRLIFDHPDREVSISASKALYNLGFSGCYDFSAKMQGIFGKAFMHPNLEVKLNLIGAIGSYIDKNHNHCKLIYDMLYEESNPLVRAACLNELCFTDVGFLLITKEEFFHLFSKENDHSGDFRKAIMNCAWALHQGDHISNQEFVDLVFEALNHSIDSVRVDAANFFDSYAQMNALPEVARRVSEMWWDFDEPHISCYLASALSYNASSYGNDLHMVMLHSKHWKVVRKSLDVMSQECVIENLSLIISLLSHNSDQVKLSSAYRLCSISKFQQISDEVVDKIVRFISNKMEQLHQDEDKDRTPLYPLKRYTPSRRYLTLVSCLNLLGEKYPADQIFEIINTYNVQVRVQTVLGIKGRSDKEIFAPALVEQLSNDNPEYRQAIVEVLGELRSRTAYDGLLNACTDSDQNVKLLAKMKLKEHSWKSKSPES